mmetsp:Transcript_976/g.2263  ORF Transcript_976/g.2263 Transcript_976/m.2263 type:complete len:350 (+) Transcript_976:155-1204(+)
MEAPAGSTCCVCFAAVGLSYCGVCTRYDERLLRPTNAYTDSQRQDAIQNGYGLQDEGEEARTHSQKTGRCRERCPAFREAVRPQGNSCDDRRTVGIAQIESYSVDALADLPADVQRRIRISAINKSNARSQEDLLERRKAEVAERKRQRREEAGHSLDVGALKTAARGMLTEHSRGWKMRDDRAEMALIAEMLKKKYWRNLAAADFKVELFRVLPSFRSDDTWRATKTQILKKDSPTDLGKYLDLIESNAKKIDKGKVEEISDTLGVEIEDGITGDEYKKLIVKHDQSIIQERQVSDATKHRRRLRAVFKHVGTELSTKKRFTSEATYSLMAEKVAAEEEEEDEGMQIL